MQGINTEFGTMGVDWEERINYGRMNEERLARAKKALENSDLDALFICRQEDVRYATGMRSVMTPVAQPSLPRVVLPKGGEPILYPGPLFWRRAKLAMPWIPHENISEVELDSPMRLADDLQKRIGKPFQGKIGIDLLTIPLLEGLQEAFPKAKFVDGYAVLQHAKIVKTKDEIECQRVAATITEAGLDAALRVLKPGVRECEVLAEACKVFSVLGSEWTQTPLIVASGPYTAPYRLLTSDRIIREGDLVIFDIGACFNGYWGDMTRTWICGDIKPTDEQIDLCQEAYDALFAACDLMRPGRTTYDVWKALQKEHNENLSRGHGTGTSPWEGPRLASSPQSATELKPGMIMSLEPYAGIQGIGGIRLENQVLVTENEPEILTTYPFDERFLREFHHLDKTTARTRK